MIEWLGILLAALLAALGLLHLYWAAGGRKAKAASIPTVNGQWAFNPTRGATVLVAGVLFTEMFIVLGRLGWWGGALPPEIFQWGTWSIVAVFGLRAVGEFRLVGFFKRVNDTPFAWWDTRFYSPLCLAIALIAFLLTRNGHNQ
ncbi:MAG: DUF3995 domain-containing protein [Acidobacteria bacterium]|nr:DUF3995 domain-containing protein [Acidobacteriota bacterium]